jgi:putative flippase GtrA
MGMDAPSAEEPERRAGSGDGHPDPRDARHWLGFLVAGTLAFLTDAGALWLAMAAGLGPFSGRILSISVALLVAWQAHRRLTFRLTTPSTLAELTRYAGVAWTSAACNYAIFALLLVVRPGISPTAALVASSLAAMVVSYLGMRFAAFRRR